MRATRHHAIKRSFIPSHKRHRLSIDGKRSQQPGATIGDGDSSISPTDIGHGGSIQPTLPTSSNFDGHHPDCPNCPCAFTSGTVV